MKLSQLVKRAMPLGVLFAALNLAGQEARPVVGGRIVDEDAQAVEDVLVTFLEISADDLRDSTKTPRHRTASAITDKSGAFSATLPGNSRYMICLSSRTQPVVENCKWDAGILFDANAVAISPLQLKVKIGSHVLINIKGLENRLESPFDPSVIAGAVTSDGRIIVGTRSIADVGALQFSLTVPPSEPLVRLWLFSRKYNFVDDSGTLLTADGPSKSLGALNRGGTRVITLSGLTKAVGGR